MNILKGQILQFQVLNYPIIKISLYITLKIFPKKKNRIDFIKL